jgi:hypothetical protein
MSEAPTASIPVPARERMCPSCKQLWPDVLTMCPECTTDLVRASPETSTIPRAIPVPASTPEPEVRESLTEPVQWQLITPQGTRIVLQAGSDQYLGRDVDNCPSAGALMNYLQISRMHCRIRATSDELIVEDDYPSTNGVFVNGQKVERHQPVSVRAGDQLRLAQDVPLQITRISDEKSLAHGRNF